MKVCTRCGVEKSLDEFAPNSHRGPGARQSWCRECHRERIKSRRALDDTTNHIYIRARGRALTQLKARHEAEYRRLLDAELEAEWQQYRREQTLKAASAS